MNLNELRKKIKEKIDQLEEMFPDNAIGVFKETILHNELVIELGTEYVDKHWPAVRPIVAAMVMIRKAVRKARAAVIDKKR